MRSPQPLTNICDFSKRIHLIFRTLYYKYTFIYGKNIFNMEQKLGSCDDSDLFYDDKYSTGNDKQRQVSYNGPSSVGHN